MKFYDKKGMIHNSHFTAAVANILHGIKSNKSKDDISNRYIIPDNDVIIDEDGYREYEE